MGRLNLERGLQRGGWSGKRSEVVPLTSERRRRLLEEKTAWTDWLGRSAKASSERIAWLRRRHGARVYAAVEDFCVCLDFDEETRLWSIAPGTLDHHVFVSPTGLDPSFGPGMVRAAAEAGDRVTFRVNADHWVELIPVPIGTA